VSETIEIRKLAILEKGVDIGGQKVFRREDSDSDNADNDQMSICIKLENKNEQLFLRISDEFEAIKQNMCFEKGIMLKLSELTKEILQFVALKFNIDRSEVFKEKKNPQLRIEIRDFIRKNHPNWHKSNSGEYLFYGIFFVQRIKTLHELSLPELKCLASSVNMSSAVYLSKTKLVAAISKHFSDNLPLHPRNEKNDLIFSPDTRL
jgi:hypothetical protein